MADSPSTNASPDPDRTRNPDRNPDPITDAPGSHPVGTGVGAAGVGAAATVAGGVLGGPIGAAVGAAVGAVAGGLAGKGIAEKIDPTVEDAYWRENHARAPYAKPGSRYDDYSPAYRTGYSGYEKGRTFDQAEPLLRQKYEQEHHGPSAVRWEEARPAALAAWSRVDQVHSSGSGMGPGSTAG